jgi:hypothetical protein
MDKGKVLDVNQMAVLILLQHTRYMPRMKSAFDPRQR